MSKTDQQLEAGVAGNEARSIICGWAVVLGLAVEIVLSAVYRHGSWVEAWSPVGATILITMGVFGEIHFAARVSRSEEELRRRSEERVASANKIAAKAHERATLLEQENLEIRDRIAGRRISKEQHDKIVSILSSAPAAFDMEIMQEGEAGLFALDILRTLTDSGWTVDKKEFPFGVVWHNLNIFLTNDPAAERLMIAFIAAKIPFNTGDEKRTKVTLMVGAKPPHF